MEIKDAMEEVWMLLSNMLLLLVLNLMILIHILLYKELVNLTQLMLFLQMVDIKMLQQMITPNYKLLLLNNQHLLQLKLIHKASKVIQVVFMMMLVVVLI